MTNTQVAIIGGGLAGLNAAPRLHRTGMGFLLLEARDWLGGRILIVNAEGDVVFKRMSREAPHRLSGLRQD